MREEAPGSRLQEDSDGEKEQEQEEDEDEDASESPKENGKLRGKIWNQT